MKAELKKKSFQSGGEIRESGESVKESDDDDDDDDDDDAGEM